MALVINQNISQTMGKKEWGMLLMLSVLWGGSFFFVGIAVNELPPLTIVTLRLVLAALTLWLVMTFLGQRLPRGINVWGNFLVMGIFNSALPFSLIVWGQTHITSGLASVLNATTPLFTVIIAGVFLADEKISVRKVISVVIGFLGVMVLIGPSSLEGFGVNVFAQLAVLCAAASYGISGVYGRRFKGLGLPPLAIATGQLMTSSLILFPISMVLDRPYELESPSAAVWLSVTCLAVFSTGLAYILYFRILSSSGITNLSMVTFLIPITAILLGVIVLGETMRIEHFMGMGFIAVSLLGIDGRLLPKKTDSEKN
ncbi:MAG: drug/metabolite transporter (DMT)-like permease [Candidatus Endobugula sp.]|jgi:drug/metabolite transporter (DMT)-like permease